MEKDFEHCRQLEILMMKKITKVFTVLGLPPDPNEEQN